MKINLEYNLFPTTDNLLTKIVYLMRILSISDKDVAIYSEDDKVKFVVFVACFLAGKTLYIARDADHLNSIAILTNIGTIISEGEFTFLKNIDLYCRIDKEALFSTDKDYMFLHMISLKNTTISAYRSLRASSFRRNTDVEDILDLRLNRSSYISLVQWINWERYTYTTRNIKYMLETISSEFKDNPLSLVYMHNLPFAKGFAYMLYFFLRGDLVTLANSSVLYNTIMNTDRPLQALLLVDGEGANKSWHNSFKYKVYSPLNRFLNKWKVTKWITKFTYDYIIRKEIFGRKNYEAIIIDKERSLDRAEFYDHARTRISTICGTYADGFTLGINRYDEKKLKIVDNTFRVMDSGNSIKIKVDSINRFEFKGKRVAENMKIFYSSHSKNESDLYHKSGLYGELNGEIMTIKADLSDIYYDPKGNIAVDVGTCKRSFMAIPYLKEVEFFKVADSFVLITSLDRNFINKYYEKANLAWVISHLKKAVKEYNNQTDEEQEISKVIISTMFFENMKDIREDISKREFIELLNQQPSNCLEEFCKGQKVL